MRVVKLGDVARESRLKWTKSKQDVPIVGLEHLIPDEIRFDAYDINTDNTFSKRFVKGQVLFGRRRAYQRKAAIAEFDGICSGDITVIEAIEGKMVSELLPFIIQTPVFFDYANRGSAGSLSPRVKWEHLLDYEFELPSLEEQKVLADKLWAAYRLKEAYKKLLVATDEMVKSQFIEMFGDSSVVRLEDKIATQSGGTPNTKKLKYYEGGNIPWLSSSEVNQGYIFSTEKFITQEGLDNSSARWIPKDSVLIAMYGATAGRVGLSTIPLTTNQAVCALLPCSSFNPIFLYYAVCQKTPWMISQCRGAAQPNISQGIIRSMELPIPPMAKQMQFVSIAKQADKSKFGDFKSQFIEMYYNTHNKQTLESVCPIMNKGITPKYVESSSVLVINQACIHWDGQRLGNIKYHNEEIPVRKRILESGDVLLNATGNGTLGRCCVFICPSDNNTYINDGHVIALSTDRAVILPEVLNTYLSLNDTQAEIYRQYVTGSTNQVDIVFSDIKKMKVPVPSMDEQILFVEVLTQADKSKFGDFKSQFIEMFGDCKSQGTLSSLCATFIDGDWIESKDQSDNGIRLIQTGNVGFGFFKGREDKSRYITEETFKKLNCTEVMPGDILISRLPDPIGRACIVPEGIGKAITAVDCTIVRLNATLLPEFLISFSKTALYASQINKIKTGTTRLRVSRGNLGNVIIPIPPIESQHRFAAIAQQADKSKFELKQCIENIDKVIKSLING